MDTASPPVISGFKNMWSLGSSTSQSRSCTLSVSFRERARLVATSVLPVPPLPLATDIITLSSRHLCPAFGTTKAIARCTCLMRSSCSIVGTDTLPAGTSSRTCTLHLAGTHAFPASAPACARTTPPGRPGAIASRHSLASGVLSIFSFAPARQSGVASRLAAVSLPVIAL